MNPRFRIAVLTALAVVACAASPAARLVGVGDRESGIGSRESDLRLRISDLGRRTSLLRSSSFAGRADLESPPPASGAVPRSRGARIAEWLRAAGWSDDAIVFAIAMLPIVELRGAIPVGIGFLHMPWWRAFPIAIAGNMLPVPFILWLLGPLARLGMRTPLGARFFDWLFTRTRRKTASVERYETLGLAVFVAVPLPATGAWTGAMAGFLMGLRFRHAIASIFLGVVVAGVVMTVLSVLGWLGAILAGVGLLAAAVGGLQRSLRREAAPDVPGSASSPDGARPTPRAPR